MTAGDMTAGDRTASSWRCGERGDARMASLKESPEAEESSIASHIFKIQI
jgi:hypothetical protein